MTTDPPIAEPDFARDVHYAAKAEAIDWHARKGKPVALCSSILAHLRSSAIPAGLLLLFGIGQMLPGPPIAQIGLPVVLAMLVIVPLQASRRRARIADQRLARGFAPISDQRHRLRATGPESRLDALRAALAAEAEEFEPHVFRVGRPRRARFMDIGTFAILFGGIFGFLMLARHYAGANEPYLVGVIVVVSVGVSVAIWSFLWPTYLRFVPGRLDILSYSLLGRGGPSVRSIDLRSVRILLLIPDSALLFFPGEGTPFLLDVGPVLGAEPLAFERAILTAAKSSAPTPPLPTDELTG